MIQRETARAWSSILGYDHRMLTDPAFAHLPFTALVWAELPIISRVDTVGV